MSHETHWKFIENLCLSISKYYLCYCITYLDFISTYTSIVEILYKISRLLGTKMDFHTHKYLFFMPNHLRHFQRFEKYCFLLLTWFWNFYLPMFLWDSLLPTSFRRLINDLKKNGEKSLCYSTICPSLSFSEESFRNFHLPTSFRYFYLPTFFTELLDIFLKICDKNLSLVYK